MEIGDLLRMVGEGSVYKEIVWGMGWMYWV